MPKIGSPGGLFVCPAVCLSVHFPILFLSPVVAIGGLCIWLFLVVLRCNTMCKSLFVLFVWIVVFLIGINGWIWVETNPDGGCGENGIWSLLALGSSRTCLVDVVSQSRCLLSCLVSVVEFYQKILVFSKQFSELWIYHSPSACAMARVVLVFGFRIEVLFNRYPPNSCWRLSMASNDEFYNQLFPKNCLLLELVPPKALWDPRSRLYQSDLSVASTPSTPTKPVKLFVMFIFGD